MSPLVRRLLAAIPRAWGEDAPFRYAAIGFGIALVLWAGGLSLGGASRAPFAVAPGSGAPAVGPIPSGADRLAPNAVPSADAPDTHPLAPDHSLDNVTVAPPPGGPTDRFGRPATAPSK